jgi:phenylalanyl-tRNA synthetase beta chain
MLASPKELALGDNHEGILDVGSDAKPGEDFAKAFGLKDDYVIDIENKMFTHRPDCFGFMGVARELAGIYNKPFKSPDWYAASPNFPKLEAEELKFSVKNELPKLTPRFMAVALSDVKVGRSPVWLEAYLARTGQKSVNNVVDYTNWYMLETGQPLHAYDYDKVKALSGGEAAIVIRHPHKGEKIKLLNGKTVEPRAEAIMIATDKQAIGIGGVMGGTETEVDENTTNIILECANFDMYSIRHTSMAHGVFTDAVTRFTKGQSPLQNLAVLGRITKEIREHAGGRVASPVIDDKHDVKPFPPVKVSADFINLRLGEKLTAAEMKKLLENVEFEVKLNGDELTVTSPFWRTDIEIPEDVVEEVGRLYGYDHLPLVLPKRDLTPAPRDPLLETKNAIRSKLAKAGANEVLTYSFVHGNLLEKTGQDPKQAFQIANALSPDLQYYRMSLMPSLLDKVHPNIKAGYDEFALFELGKVHGQDLPSEEGLPGEYEFTGLMVTAADKLKKPGAAYYQARKYLIELAGVPLEFKPVGEAAQKFAVVQPYEPGRSAMVSVKGGSYLGIIGEFRPSVSRALKLPRYCAGFEIDTTQLQQVFEDSNNYAALPRFPKLTQDITLKVASDLAHQELSDFLRDELNKIKPNNTLAELGPLDIFQPENARHKNVTFRLTIASYERTLTDAEVNKLLGAIATAAKTKLHAERI